MRLIDADKMKNDMKKKEQKDLESFMSLCSKLNEAGLKRLLEYMEMLLRMPEYRKSDDEISFLLDSQPIAYDVDKVCRKISENKDMDNLIDADLAIKIVKGGGR